MKPEEKLFEIVRKLMLYHPIKKTYRLNKYAWHHKLMDAMQKHGKVHTFEEPLDPTGFHFAIEGHKGVGLNLSLPAIFMIELAKSDQHAELAVKEIDLFLEEFINSQLN